MRTVGCRGTTLIELLVVLFLIALISGLVGPPVAARLDKLSLQNTASSLASELRKAQASARTKQSAVFMNYDNQEFRFFRQSEEIGSFKLPASISVVGSVGTYVFLPSGQIVAPAPIDLKNERGRIMRLKASTLDGIVVTSGDQG